jgi:5-amino-6-(5-phospho-D-ribitylamino)uracil phosphatase
MTQIALIATDIDGTLLGSRHWVPEANIEALKAAHAAGIRVAMVTARKRDSTMHIADRLGIPYAMICQIGATIYDSDGTLLAENAIEYDTALQIAELCDSLGYGMVTTIQERNYYTRGDNLPERLEFPGYVVASNREAMFAAPTRLLIVGEQAARHMMNLLADTTLQMNRHYYGTVLNDVVITAASASKERSLTTLCAHYGITASAVLAMGDAESDIGMLRWAGIGVAIGLRQTMIRLGLPRQ